MLQSETATLQYLDSETALPFPDFPMILNTISPFEFNKFLSQFPAPQPQQSSDDADENQTNIIDERKQRRMISNRESARRSRMRKRRLLDELWAQVVRLRNDNHFLVDKINNMSASHDKVLAENKTLREDVSGLRQIVAELQLGSTYCSLKELEEVTCDANLVGDESSEQSVTTSNNPLR